MRFRRLWAVTAAVLCPLADLLLGPVQPAAAAAPGPNLAAAPNFKAPFPCGQKWTYSHHSAEVRRALDFVRADGGTTNGTPVLASAAGTAYRYYETNGAGNYISIEHGGGWRTYYFHLSAFSVANGASVTQGQQIGTTGSTGNSSGPHIHYEQLYSAGTPFMTWGSGVRVRSDARLSASVVTAHPRRALEPAGVSNSRRT